jgi:hypothetical protein
MTTFCCTGTLTRPAPEPPATGSAIVFEVESSEFLGSVDTSGVKYWCVELMCYSEPLNFGVLFIQKCSKLSSKTVAVHQYNKTSFLVQIKFITEDSSDYITNINS